MSNQTRDPSSAGASAARGGGWAVVGAVLGGWLGPQVGLDPIVAGGAAAGGLVALFSALGKAARDTLHYRTVKMIAPGFWVRLMATLFVLPLFLGCAVIPSADGQAYVVGEVTIVESTAAKGTCELATERHTTDDGAKDDGKTSGRSETVKAPAPCRIVVGGSFSDNAKAMLGSLAGFLAGLML